MNLMLLPTQFKQRHLIEVVWVASGQLISIALGFISIKLLTSMGSDEFGKYSLVLTIAAFLSAILYGPVEQGFVRFYFDYINQRVGSVFINLFFRFIIVTGSIGVLLTLLTILIGSKLHFSVKPLEIAGMGLFIVVSISTNVFNSIINLLRKRKVNTMLLIAERVLTIFFLFVIAKTMKLNAILCFFSLASALLIVLGIKIKTINKYVPINDSVNINEIAEKRRQMIRVLRSFAAPFVIWGATGWLQSNSERWMIANFLSLADVGCFAIVATIANYLIAIPSGIISQLLQPVIYEKTTVEDNDLEKKKNGFKMLKVFTASTVGLVIFAMTLTSIAGKQIIELISNTTYSSHWHILPIICLGTGLFNIGQSLTTIGVIMNRPRIYLFPKIASGLIALLLNVLLIVKIGIFGIAIAQCLSSGIYLGLIISANRKITKLALH